MLKKPKWHLVLLLLLGGLASPELQAQFTATGQLRTRAEIRSGTGNLVPKGSQPAAFMSQRSRLIFGYRWDRISFGVTLQDVRVWGQDASSITAADGNRLMAHEAWADLVLANKTDTSIKFRWFDQMSLKIGRQELVYDDARLLGNLDWLQQGRRHDMVLLKTVHKGWQVDIGQAFNQNTDAFGVTGTSYVPGNLPAYVKNSIGEMVPTPAGVLPLAAGGNAANNSAKTGTPVWVNPPNTNAASQQYKSFTSLYISRKFKQTKFSGLFFNDNFGKYRMDSSGSASAGYVYGRRFSSAGSKDNFNYSGINSRFTYGLMINTSLGTNEGFGKVSVQAAYYAQSGSNREGVNIKGAYHYTLAATWQKNKISITPGYDVLSGKKSGTAADEKFDPLYGTPHRHWGYMDYFYVGTGSPAGGLNNPYLKFKYAANALSLGLDLHHFSLNQPMLKDNGTAAGKNLGNEIDLLLNYNINRFTNIEMGYSLMYASKNMAIAKGQATNDALADNYRRNGNWFYTMFKFTPDFLYTKQAKTN